MADDDKSVFVIAYSAVAIGGWLIGMFTGWIVWG